MNEKILVALSGGVDSTVAAMMLKNSGFDVTGATIKMFSGDGTDGVYKCSSGKDIEDAASAAKKLGIEHIVFDYSDEFKKEVIDRFAYGYINGETPNPCVECNRYMKFGKLLDAAEKNGFSHVATGHYVRTEQDKNTGRWLLKKGLDTSKDQSYFLYSLTQEQLSKVIFPVGELTKSETRRLAEEYGFLNSDKPDSQDVCFIPDGDYKSFIERAYDYKSSCGVFTDISGQVLGKHNGAIGFTIGQRKGLGVAAGRPVYVVKKDMKTGTVILGDNSDLFSKSVKVRNINYISIERPTADIPVEAKIRYSQKTSRGILHPVGDDEAVIEFDQPQRAPSPGQAAVFYDGEIVIGGGTISI